MKKSIKVLVFKTSTLDNFSNGQDPMTTTNYNPHEFAAKDFEEALKLISELYGVPSHFEDRLELQILENEEGIRATESEMRRFEKGELDLWAVDYSFYLVERFERDIPGAELKALFPNLENLE